MSEIKSPSLIETVDLSNLVSLTKLSLLLFFSCYPSSSFPFLTYPLTYLLSSAYLIIFQVNPITPVYSLLHSSTEIEGLVVHYLVVFVFGNDENRKWMLVGLSAGQVAITRSRSVITRPQRHCRN